MGRRAGTTVEISCFASRRRLRFAKGCKMRCVAEGETEGIMRNVSERVFAGLCGMVYFVVAAGAMAMIAVSADGQDRSQTRSMVISKGGIVASESPLASQAGVRIL